MDWNIFWSAFGAIGTTLGSMITAIAVIIAVKQYKQPLKKIVQVKLTSAIPCGCFNKALYFYNISIRNRGIRPVQIDSIFIQGLKKNILINNMQYKSDLQVVLPVKIEAEENKNIFFESDIFENEIKKAVDCKILKKNKKLIIFVTDSLGDEYVYKTKYKVSNFL